MGLVTRTFTYSAGAVIVASQHNTNETTLYNLVNGNLDTNNLSPSAALVDTQLAQLTTASKVSGAALTSLASIPSGAGVIPAANLPGSGGSSNLLINGGPDVWQRGTSFESTTTPANSDDTYLADRWTLLSDGNDIVDVTRQVSANGTGSSYKIRLDVETGNKKFGIIQFVEAATAAQVIGGTVSLAFRHRVVGGTTIGNIRAGILSWDSTADSVTSDVVSAWNAAGSDPTLVANWTFENTPASISTSTSWAQATITNISIDTASTANIAVFIWSDDVTTTVGEFLELEQISLVPGATASTTYPARSFSDELRLCQRYYWKSFAYGTAPAQSAGNTGVLWYRCPVDGAVSSSYTIIFPGRMFKIPTMTYYNPNAANALWRNITDTADSGTASDGLITDWCAGISNGQAAGDASGDALRLHAQAEAEM